MADDSMTPITSVAILSLPQRAQAEDAAFFPLALSHCPEPSPDQQLPVVETSKGWGSGEVASQRADAA
jgi:hypothetical protein